MDNKIYSVGFADILLPGAAIGYSFRIANPGREMKIKSISWDVSITNQTTAENLPLCLNTSQDFNLQVGNSNNKIARAFEITGVSPAVSNGDLMTFHNPKQYLFNGFFVSEYLIFSYQYFNNHAASAFFQECTIVVETEEKINY